MQAKGGEREKEWRETLKDEGLEDITGAYETEYDQETQTDTNNDRTETTWEEFKEEVRELNPGDTAFAREVKVEGKIGVFDVSGKIDFLLVLWDGANPYLRAVETKASRRDKTYQRIQVAIYKLLLEQNLSEEPLQPNRGVVNPEDIECVVGRIDESTNRIQDILNLEALDLENELDDVNALMNEGGKLEGILSSEVDDLNYQLNPKCDTCVFNVHCYPESARERKLELLNLTPSTVRALEDETIETLDDLAELDLESEQAERIRGKQGMKANLQKLQDQAKARIQNLPELEQGEEEEDNDQNNDYEVTPLSHQADSQLPEHEIDGDRVVRIYLNVDYDYTENRIGALAAHITNSEGELKTDFQQTEAGYQTDPEPYEELEDETRDVHGEFITRYKTSEWSGDFDRDTAAEKELIQGFLHDLVDKIASVAESEEARIHFYVWSSSEIENLVEGCSRGGSQLLAHLQELMGCREPTEQLIYSTLREEIDSRFALGWTGRGLSVATSLNWFNDKYHWTRKVNGQTVRLDDVFTQDIFDFKTDLYLNDDGEWVPGKDAEEDEKYKFEVRSRFYDNLPAPYWHAVWGTLRNPEDASDQKLKNALERYQQAEAPGLLRGYLRARTQALRWIEEKVKYKNEDIGKPALAISDLRGFELDVTDVSEAAINFLLLDNHVETNEWLTSKMQPPIQRVPEGKTIPIQNPTWNSDEHIDADISIADHDISLQELKNRTAFEEGDFVRISPCEDNPSERQRYWHLVNWGGTAVISDLDWDNEQIELSPIPHGDGDTYKLPSRLYPDESGTPVFDNDNGGWNNATVDDSISSFTAGKVDDKLQNGNGEYVYEWFDPKTPRIPPLDGIKSEEKDILEQFLKNLKLGGHSLMDSQREAVLKEFDSRVNLIHGPPGTGKTTTASATLLSQSLVNLEEDQIVLIVGSTHRAVDNLLARIHEHKDSFFEQAQDFGYEPSEVNLMKISGHGGESLPEDIETFSANSCITKLDEEREGSILVVGGTVNGALKLGNTLSDSATFGSGDEGFQTPYIIVDEASMMVFPEFLALASLVEETGEITLAGDHRQLPPIVSHDWEEEDRPPVELYQPFNSAFEAVRNLADYEDVTKESISMSPLTHSFRLPPSIRTLISRVYRSRDDIELTGEDAQMIEIPDEEEDIYEAVWENETGVYLIVHSERNSDESNEFEADIIENLIESADQLPEDSTSVMTPHRAQRTYLGRRLEEYSEGPVDIIDTVESLQGGESENIIISATASDPSSIGSKEEFLLDLNRANVAFSRTKKRLIVVCSEHFLNHIPPEMEDYKAAMLWKSLRNLCTKEIISTDHDGEKVSLFVPDPESEEIQELRQ